MVVEVELAHCEVEGCDAPVTVEVVEVRDERPVGEWHHYCESHYIERRAG